MVAFNKDTDLPTNVDSVEKLATWAILILSELYPTTKVYEVVGKAPELVATGNIFDINIPDENWNFTKTYRFVGRVSLPATVAFKKGTKTWQTVTALGTAAIPQDYKS
jgi:hypothetical protein